ncbi:MAG: hypothetical protein IE916_01340 [Epsilonproteobacteria bacterium]|nr:hypothetical protein [Campylobacterota bacterium]
MYRFKNNSLTTFDIATYLNTKALFEKEYDISHAVEFENLRDESFCYVKSISAQELGLITAKALIITQEIRGDAAPQKSVPEIIISSDAKRDFYRIVKEFFIEERPSFVDKSAHIDASASLGINVNVGEGSYIGKNVTIGNNTYIGKGVIINANVTIGNNCYLKDGSIINSESFAFFEEDGRTSYIPCFGHLILEDSVWIGAKAIIETPSIGKALIAKGVKIDDLVQIGSDTSIGADTQIAAGSIIGRGVKIKEHCSLGINTLVKPSLTIHEGVVTGMGAVVIHELEKDGVYVGNPARRLPSKGE